MLQAFRNSAKGKVGKTIVGLIVITFVFFGAESIISIAGNSAPATVNGDDISENDYQRLLNSRQQELTSQYGAEIGSQLANSPFLRQEVLNILINQKLQAQLTQDLKFEVSDDQVLKTLTEVPAFQLNGKFDQDMYLNLLSANGFNHKSFIASQRAQAALTQMQSGLVNSAFVNEKSVARYASLDAQQRKVAYRTLSAADYLASVAPSTDDLQAYYDENQDQFLSEERVKVKVVRVAMADMIADALVTDDEIDSAYQSYLAALASNEQRTVSHILFADGADNAAEAQSALARLAAGEAFADLATELSDDPGSAEFGGSLGELIPDVYVAEFYNAAMELTQEGDVSDLVTTEYGVHLIQLDSLSTAQAASLADQTAELTAVLKERKARDEMILVAADLADDAFASDDIADVALNFQTDVIETDWLTRSSDDELMAEDGFAAAVFSPTVVDDGMISSVVKTAAGDLIVVQKLDYQGEAVKPFVEVETDIRTLVADRMATELMSAALADILASTVALDDNWTDPELIDRNATGLPDNVVEKAFTLPAPVNGLSVATLEDGDLAYVIAVTEVVDTSPSETQQLAAKKFATTFAGSAQYQVLFNQVREAADISIRP
ncbi:MAG: SurA N-terminal domain-containing protein [Reinekea forsetii]|jgi:peptidyl-prolyl cis-trans isomerase D|uniref:Periplasmic chaperone PpiD n=1 Tax=Reinekea forsetii TaxID=1336806 RepID=A0A2K8KRV6_9GAMM|nr:MULTISPECIES: SurA N-terminal domain-containing protein [Reinekea]ATX76809.1 peptidyl-prolyl cis-trans isomerase D, putative [Reinekea forsetii]MDO7674745.1 SurA N-terminal domain-containing protein [Reinekea forsetii]